ncbi:hypothetical protein [Polyangium spumosum]
MVLHLDEIRERVEHLLVERNPRERLDLTTLELRDPSAQLFV